MKTSVAFLGILSTVFVATYSMEEPLGDHTGSIRAIEKSADDTVWRLTISGIGNQCIGSFIAQKENLVSSQTLNTCIGVFPDLEYLARIKVDSNGDITLFHQNGSKLVEFMESESADHESFWPAHPLMTLAKADTSR